MLSIFLAAIVYNILEESDKMASRRKERKKYLDSLMKSNLNKPLSHVYPVIDTDLARDNVENNIPAADLNDL